MCVALVAAVLASVGDFGLLYVAQSSGDASLGWPTPPAGTLALSQWLGAFTIPLYGVAYVSLSHGFTGRVRSIVRWLGIYAAALGGVVHALTGLAIFHRTAETPELGGAFSLYPGSLPFLLPFVLAAALGLVTASIAFASGILRGQSNYPRWLGYLNPLSCIFLITCAGFTFHYGRLFLVPMAPNVGSAAFFALALAVAHREEGREHEKILTG